MTDTRTFRIVDEDGDYYETTGDPMDALNAAYRERAHLTALLASQYPSHIGHTDPASPNWAVLTVELPTGQACWHIAPADMDLFAHVQPTPRYARGWDGHSTEEKYRRIDQLVADLHPEAGLDELKRQQDERDGDVRPDAFDLDCEELVEIFADFIGEWDRSHEVITVGLPDHLPQLRIPHLRRTVVALQRLGRERDAALKARDGNVRAVVEAVWLTEDDGGKLGVWRDPGNARQQIIQDWGAETPGDYEWVNDTDSTHEMLLCNGETTGVTLWMALVADAALDARDAKAPTHCICGCELGKSCACEDVDHEPAARDAKGGEQR